MLTYAVRCPPVAQLAVMKLDPAYFDASTQFEFQSVWVAARLYWQQFGAPPPMHAVGDLALQVMIQQDIKEPVLIERMEYLVAEIYTFEEDPWNVEYGKQLLSMFFDSVYSGQVGAIGQTMGGLPRTEVRTALEQQYQSLNVSTIKTIDPFDFDADTFRAPPREPTGVTFVDLLLGGGTLETECYGVLGPSGGGKTVLSVQLGCSIASRGQHVEYFTYEQPAEEMRPRILSCAAKVSSSKLLAEEDEQLDEMTRKQLVEAQKTHKQFFHLHDRASEGDNIAEIGMMIQQSIDEGRRPRLVIVDWVWPLIMRMTAVSDRRQVDERKLMQKATDDFKSMAAKYRVCFWLVHQLSVELAKKSPGRKPQWFNSAEAGSFAWLLHYCFAIGTKDAHDICWLVGSKARSAKNQDALLHLNGEFNRFEPTDKRYVYDKRSGTFIDEEGVNKIDTFANDGSDFADGSGGGVAV
jgi:hypothetical protein